MAIGVVLALSLAGAGMADPPSQAARPHEAWSRAAAAWAAEDYGEAARLFRIAADAGDLQALWNLAICHDLGQGVVKDAGEARRLFRQAAERGHAESMLSLALKLELAGEADEAGTWFRRWAATGDHRAPKALALRGIAAP